MSRAKSISKFMLAIFMIGAGTMHFVNQASTIHVQIDNKGDAKVWAEPEQDYE